jgi:hypothetical protein
VRNRPRLWIRIMNTVQQDVPNGLTPMTHNERKMRT